MMVWPARVLLSIVAFSSVACGYCVGDLDPPTGVHSVTACTEFYNTPLDTCPIRTVRFGEDMQFVAIEWTDGAERLPEVWEPAPAE
ncbi:MAG: hypothetical protein ACJAYU_002686 [Bradymonadia bacterium]|jgi:hypothetical protein